MSSVVQNMASLRLKHSESSRFRCKHNFCFVLSGSCSQTHEFQLKIEISQWKILRFYMNIKSSLEKRVQNPPQIIFGSTSFYQWLFFFFFKGRKVSCMFFLTVL